MRMIVIYIGIRVMVNGIDGPSGAGVYIVKDNGILPPSNGWISLQSDHDPIPTVDVLDEENCKS